jgi:hypothetical protein
MKSSSFMKPPKDDVTYKIGDRVEVNCDHEDKDGNRIREWLRGTIVQVDNKLIAVQFKQNVYLTDGWMVPDHILWFQFDSVNVRPYQSKRKKTNPIDEIDLDNLNLF